jgi:hypothetical protein
MTDQSADPAAMETLARPAISVLAALVTLPLATRVI